MNLPSHVVALVVVGSLVCVLISVAILRLSCYLVREDVPSWASALGIKIGALVVGSIFNWFVYSTAAAAARGQKSKADVEIALSLFALLATILLNAGVYKVTMPWLSYGKSLAVVLIEAVIGSILGALLLVGFVAVAHHMGFDMTDFIEEVFPTPP